MHCFSCIYIYCLQHNFKENPLFVDLTSFIYAMNGRSQTCTEYKLRVYID